MNSTKQRILSAAKTVLIKEGNAGFSMRKVAAEASVRLNNVQYYYKTKTELVDGLLQEYLNDYKTELVDSFESAGQGKKGLATLIKRILFEEAKENEIKLSVAITAFAEQAEFSQKLNNFYNDFYALLQDYLKQISGKKRVDLAIKKGASLLLPVINGYGLVSQSLSLNAKSTAEMLTDTIWEMISSN